MYNISRKTQKTFRYNIGFKRIFQNVSVTIRSDFVYFDGEFLHLRCKTYKLFSENLTKEYRCTTENSVNIKDHTKK